MTKPKAKKMVPTKVVDEIIPAPAVDSFAEIPGIKDLHAAILRMDQLVSYGGGITREMQDCWQDIKTRTAALLRRNS